MHQSAVVLSISVFISLLFLVMLLCLLGIVAVLCRPGPGDGAGAGGTSAQFKRKALQNVLVVMVPSVLAYSPLVAVVPYLALIIGPHVIRPAQCRVLHLLLLFPNAGLFIGPAFYLSRIQAGCCRTEPQTSVSRTE